MGLSFSWEDYKASLAGLKPGAEPAREMDRDLWRGVVWLFEQAGLQRGVKPETIDKVTFVDRDTLDVEVNQ